DGEAADLHLAVTASQADLTGIKVSVVGGLQNRAPVDLQRELVLLNLGPVDVPVATGAESRLLEDREVAVGKEPAHECTRLLSVLLRVPEGVTVRALALPLRLRVQLDVDVAAGLPGVNDLDPGLGGVAGRGRLIGRLHRVSAFCGRPGEPPG